jgi:TonB family protein
MYRSRRSALVLVITVAVLAGAARAVAQPVRPVTGPPPAGKRLEAQDGDTIIVRAGGRVRLVQRSEANVRAIHNPAGRWVVLLVDYVDPAGASPDGIVDNSYRFNDVEGAWPLGERWEGSAVVDNYSILQGANPGVGLTTSAGFVQLFGNMGADWFRDARAVTLTFRSAGQTTSAAGRYSFAEAERRAVDEAAQNAGMTGGGSVSTAVLPNGSTAIMGVRMSGAMTPSGSASPSPAPTAPVRVGGNIRTPVKIAGAAPLWPAPARQAGIGGVVLVEITIGPDGGIKDARILRSIPLLDQAALDAVRQWRYEPTLLNGMPVPVIMTVTVNFQ